MKIAVTGTRGFPGVQGGVESHCEQLYTHIVKLGCDVTVFGRKPYLKNKITIFNGVKIVAVDCPRNKFLEAIIHTFRTVLQAKKLKPDILHIHAVGPSLFVPFARALGIKVVVTNHGPDYLRKKWPLPAKIFLKFCERIGVLFANEIITIAPNIHDDILKKYGRESTILPNGVNVPQLAETEEFLHKYGLKRRNYILTVGRLVPEKGFDDLIEAFNICDFDDIKLVIVGDADHVSKYCINFKSKAGKNKNIVLTGFLKGQSLHELYSHAALFVLPSYHEGLPIVLLEAMSYGLSCIASDIQANLNVELDKERYFVTGNAKSIADKIREFIQKPIDAQQRIKQINTITSLYNWPLLAEETVKIYKRVISR